MMASRTTTVSSSLCAFSVVNPTSRMPNNSKAYLLPAGSAPEQLPALRRLRVPAPGQPALDLHLEREAEERADHHYAPQNGNAAERRLDADCVDDVGGDEQL